MNEKVTFRLVVMLTVIAFLFGGTAGFFLGRGNPVGLVKPEHADRKLEATIGSLTAELDRERRIAERIRIEQAEERSLITAALGVCRSAGDGVQGIITKMEILNGLVRELERRVGGGSDLPGGE